MSPTLRMSRVILKMAPCGMNELCPRMLLRSKISCTSIALRQLSRARASLSANVLSASMPSFIG